MKRSAFVLVFLLLSVPAFAGEVINDAQKPSVLFAFSAKNGSFQDEVLTFKSPSLVIYFSDRPARVAGHISLDEFVALWASDAAGSYKTDPPNAVVSISGQQGNDAVVELLKATMEGDSLRLTIRPIKGALPALFAECAVFVDTFIPGTLGVFSHMP